MTMNQEHFDCVDAEYVSNEKRYFKSDATTRTITTDTRGKRTCGFSLHRKENEEIVIWLDMREKHETSFWLKFQHQ